MDEIAITDHSFSSVIYHMTLRKFDKQNEIIKDITSIKVLQGIEANLISIDGDIDVPQDVFERTDLLILGFHRYVSGRNLKENKRWISINGFGSNAEREKLIEVNTKAYISALEKYPIDVITHLNHRALVDVKKVCEKARDYGVYIELNEKHVSALNGHAQELIDSGVNFVVGTDAHDSQKTGKFDRVKAFIEENNIPKERVYGIDGRRAEFKQKAEGKNEF